MKKKRYPRSLHTYSTNRVNPEISSPKFPVARINLSGNWREQVSYNQQIVDIILTLDMPRVPVFIIKTKYKQDFNVVYGAITLHEYSPEGPLIHLKVFFKEVKENVALKLDCFINPLDMEGKKILTVLKVCHYVKIILMEPLYQINIVQQSTWSPREREEIAKLITKTDRKYGKVQGNRSSNKQWQQAIERYQKEAFISEKQIQQPQQVPIKTSVTRTSTVDTQRNSPPQRTSIITKETQANLIELYKNQQPVENGKQQGKQQQDTFFATSSMHIALAKKYRLTDSAEAMINYLVLDKPILNPNMIKPMWIEREQPIYNNSWKNIGAFFFFPASSSTTAYSTSLPWYLQIIDVAGHIITTYRYEPGEQSWAFAHSHICPWNSCFQQKSTKYCNQCILQKHRLTCWFATALLVVSGAFAEVQEPQIQEELIEKHIKPKGEEKIGHISHRYNLIRFDASVIQSRNYRSAHHAENTRGSWIEKALEINPNVILYVDKNIGPTERFLQHERFTHMQGQIVPVRAHTKRVPMKLHEVKHYIKVFASRFEKQK